MQDQYDGIILGAGHNSLVLQAYLSKAGLKTVCLDRRSVAGGGLTTVEWPADSGFLHNTHSFFHRGLTSMPWFSDLELDRHGVRYLTPELNVALVTEDDRVLMWWSDFERTHESFARFCPADAKKLREWVTRFRPIVQNILVPEAQSPPLPANQRRDLLSQSEDGQLLLRVSELSPIEFVQREFTHPVIQAGLLFFNGLREVDLRCRGFGHHIPALLASGRVAQMCEHGSKRLAEGLASVVQQHGGEIHLNAELRRILVEAGSAVGVEMADGSLVRARKFVASSLNPQQTFLDLIGETSLPNGLAEKARGYSYNLVAPLFALNLNLAEPPCYRASEKNPELNRALMTIVGLDRPGAFESIVNHHESGAIPPPVMWGSCPTLFDASQAPQGFHTAFMWEKLPFRLRGNPENWDNEKRRHGEELLAFWTKYAPSLEGTVIDSFTASPRDIEREFHNMKDGDLLVGSFSNGQIGFNRPFAGAGQYRTPIKQLYLCGSCCHPGGNITGLPGYNSAQVILRDLGFDAPWMPSSLEGRLANC
ncbi:MAG: NAD(P)/FAD-dependent oxidoreductase [Verrucomicrobia bacterium]|nr:NAD(P)/FAD-dependent oxidoreductase [Verrucomicrobiota bacterium]